MDQSESTAANLDRRSRGRWFQYSLRSFLVLMTALSLWLGFTVERARNQKEVVQAIESMGGSIHFAGEHRSRLRMWLAPVIGEDFFRDIDRLVLRKARLLVWFEPGATLSRSTWRRIEPNIDMDRRLQDLIPKLRRLPTLKEISVEPVPFWVPQYRAEVLNELKYALPQCKVNKVKPELFMRIDDDNWHATGIRGWGRLQLPGHTPIGNQILKWLFVGPKKQ
jgi:hypothetical protein